MIQSDVMIPTTTSPNPMNDVVKVETSLGWNPDEDEHRRAFIIENWDKLWESCSDPNYWFRWMKSGESPAPPKLKTIK